MKLKVPQHIGIIMDGNGRWALKRGWQRLKGHSMGVDALRRIIDAAYDLDVKTLTAYAFSTENWSRPKKEVDEIMNLLLKFLKNYKEEIRERDIRIVAMGDVTKFSPEIQTQMALVEGATANNSKLTVYIAINYGGRAEIVDAVKKIKNSNIDAVEITEKTVEQFLYTQGNSNVDLIIRTSGEMRMSNFLLWQGAYAEFYVTRKLFPQLEREDFIKAIKAYNKRIRRFGAVK